MRFAASSVLFVGVLSLLCASAASAASITSSFSFSGFTVPDDDSGVEPDVTVTFSWDDQCVAGCTLQVDLMYNDVGGLSSTAHTLSGVTWDTSGSIVVDPARKRRAAPNSGPVTTTLGISA